MISEELRDRIKAVADPLIAEGMDHEAVRFAVWRELRIGIGGGGGGLDKTVPTCPYCGANGGGGHGGLCPGGPLWACWTA